MIPKILVVDDDPGNLRIVSAIVKFKGYEVLTAQDGLEALAKIKKEKPHLVVLDVMMPEINGYDVCYHLRFNKDFEKIPIILVTVRERELDESIGKRVNIDYIHKPVDSKVLIAKMDALLGQGMPPQPKPSQDVK